MTTTHIDTIEEVRAANPPLLRRRTAEEMTGAAYEALPAGWMDPLGIDWIEHAEIWGPETDAELTDRLQRELGREAGAKAVAAIFAAEAGAR